MRRLLGILVFSAAIAAPLYCQERGPQHEAALEDRLAGWKLANFAILAAGLGYLIQQAEGVFDVVGVFAGMFVLMAFVLIVDWLVTLIEQRLLAWRGQ